MTAPTTTRAQGDVMTWHPDIPLHYRDQIVTGDARALARDIPDASVDLVFTDPVYERIEDYAWLASEAARVLKPSGAVLVWQQVSLLPDTVVAMRPPLHYRHTLVMTRSNVAKLSCREYWFSHWTPCIWLSVTPDSRPFERFRDAIDSPFVPAPNLNHKWAKPIKPILAWMGAFTKPGALIWEPFCGGGTIPAVCKMLGRHYIASEIDPATAERARERVLNTQPPLPGLVVEQLEVAL